MQQLIKQVVFIGGIHGVGKSTICASLKEKFGWVVVKQRKLLIEVGQAMGLGWPEVADYHDILINQVADRLIDALQLGNRQVLLVDCHYAIPSSVALRSHGSRAKFIPNLDWRLVKRVKQEFQSKFVLLEVDPKMALNRIELRTEATHYENTLEYFQAEAVAEKDIFLQLISQFNVSPCDFLCLEPIEVEQTVNQLNIFINS